MSSYRYMIRKWYSTNGSFYTDVQSAIRSVIGYNGSDESSKFLRDHVGFVVSTLDRTGVFSAALELRVSGSDVMEGGLIGLSSAHRKLNPNERGFWRYARKAIRNEGMEAVLSNTSLMHIPLDVLPAKRTIEEMFRKHGYNSETFQALAERLQMSIERIRWIEGFSIPRFSDLSDVAKDDDSCTNGYSEFLCDPKNFVDEISDRDEVDRLLRPLDDREKYCVLEHFGKDKSFSEINGAIGVTRAGAHKITQRALAKLNTTTE